MDVEQIMCEIFEKYGKKYAPEGVEKNADMWRENKVELVNLLRKHPNWNEKEMAIVFDGVDEERKIDCDEVEELSYAIRGLGRGLLSYQDLHNFGDAINYSTYEYDRLIRTKEQVLGIKRYSGIDCVVGQKTSKVIGKICKKFGVDKHDDYNKVFARIADSLNPLLLKRKGILSVHPADYLEMSSSEFTWSSCHKLAGGEFQAGTLSYMNDGCTLIFYTVDEKTEGDYHKAAKITRQVFAFGNGGILLQSRLYPKGSDCAIMEVYRNIVQLAISECLGVPNLWMLKRGIDEVEKYFATHVKAKHYADYSEHPCGQNVSILKSLSESADGVENIIIVGNVSYCVKCGNELTKSDNITCDDCCSLTCAQCGKRHHERSMRIMNGLPYCQECVFYCEDCGRYLVGNKHLARTRRGRFSYVCDNCFNSGNYIRCGECGDYYYIDYCTRIDGEYYCRSCVLNQFVRCCKCNQYVRYNNAVVDNDNDCSQNYCSSCANNVCENISSNCDPTSMSMWLSREEIMRLENICNNRSTYQAARYEF